MALDDSVRLIVVFSFVFVRWAPRSGHGDQPFSFSGLAIKEINGIVRE